MYNNSVLIVDDEESILKILGIVLENEGYKVYTTTSPYKALEYLEEYIIDILLTDYKMPYMDGLTLMRKSLEIDSDLQVIIITAYGDVETAVEAMKSGAFNYLEKNFTNEELLLIIKQAKEKRNLIEKNKSINKVNVKNNNLCNIVTESPKMKKTISLINRVAQSKATVLLSGESGVGKDVMAKLVHKKSDRNKKEMVVVNCGAIPENLVESELFGHEKGAFTGAINKKIGKFQQADGSTIFLDEIGDLPFSMQVKLLRVLQEGEVIPVGGLEKTKIDVRVIAATNKNLEEEVRKGNFREDLFYRLNVIDILIPPLRERIEDIGPLAMLFLNKYSTEYDKSLEVIDLGVLDILYNYDWPGNVRELDNVIEHSVVIANEKEKVLKLEYLPKHFRNVETKDYEVLKDGLTLKEYEKIIIKNTLLKNNGNKTKTARDLGFRRQTLYNKLKEYKFI